MTDDTDARPALMDWRSLVIAKFPAFDGRWDDDEKSAWFDAYLKLIDLSTGWINR